MGKKETKKAVDRRLIRRLYFYIEPYRWFVVLAIALTLTAAFLGTVRPKLTQIAVDDYIAFKDLEGLLKIIGLLFLAQIGEFVLQVINTYITRWFGQGSLFSLRNAVFKKIQHLNVQFFDKNPIGKLITRTTSDIEALSELLSDGVVAIIGDCFRIIFILYFMFSMSWELTLVTIAILPFLFYATFWFKNKVRISFLEVRDQIARLNSFVQEHINGMDIVQLFNREKKQHDKFKDINAAHRKAHIETIFYFSIFWPLVEMMASFAMALVVWYGGGRALMGGVTFGVLLAFIQYSRQFFMPIRGLSEKFNTLQSALASSERIFNVMDIETEVQEPDEPKTISDPKGQITFENVWFKYNEDGEQILKDVSFTANEGETIAIVGATGAGKTTIINLLLRFYDIQKGSIKLDGIDIRDLSLNELRSNFGLVLQDNALFSGTILENITLGNPDISREEVIEAAHKVEAHRFIEKLKGTYDYKLRERGASLSMGQKQLICFVRALVYNPQILILDEATSSVDSETESLVTAASDKMMKGRTSIVVAHRLSTIQGADKILVMHKGVIRESGSHQELIIQENGLYKKLYELQYKDQLVEG
ncbi:MAG TPA: antibiotic ABC transporter ATP-binding protein [Balneola sp.]|nr:antibiotic ABC transporter ATP-binding protein [Balneola sp.]MAO77683.1 antibiotic ABC transporter ATP-binding protein [Balneola sp.]MBF63979.1 antibiotic ABC transporter ATP-binding protein [Balneola sp.]HAH50683.1 antibiotic ABC transporter ATP-binding protein [Balneola sp.]HBZ37104.1 antibiotic ABC transporter ATP-binding protein [Balneola sp.]